MKRILIDGRCLLDTHSGGVRRLVLSFIESLLSQKADDTEIIVGFTSYAPLPKDLLHLPHQHRRIPNKLVILLSFVGMAYERYFTGVFDEIIYPNLDFTAPSKTPYRVLVHDLSYLIEPTWYPIKSRLWHFLLRPKRLLRNAQKLLAVSTWTARDLEILLSIQKEKIEVLTLPPFLLSTKQQEIPQLKNTSYFLLLGANNIRKNSETVLRAFEQVYKENETIFLVTTGNTPQQPGVIQLGWLGDEEISWLFYHAKALLYPSWYEGFGIPLLEADQAKIPIIASTSSSLPDIAPLSATFVPPHQPQLWALAMQSVIRRG